MSGPLVCLPWPFSHWLAAFCEGAIGRQRDARVVHFVVPPKGLFLSSRRGGKIPFHSLLPGEELSMVEQLLQSRPIRCGDSAVAACRAGREAGWSLEIQPASRKGFCGYLVSGARTGSLA